MDEKTYNLYKIVHNGKTSVLEAVKAIAPVDGQEVEGWIINIAGRQRTFKANDSGYHVYPLKK